ncbi:MAG: tRNA threonylcarbamoyladenosine dehydratase, partial [Clostridia bacterium]|nr:tRNA threonylcarbamoyladenosine dehydratase [Clostridia bacterium]
MDERFCRTAMLLGEEALDKLASVRVAIFGIGGVGGYIAEALARSGVGALDLIDSDVVSVSNVNRQIVALDSTVGKLKTEAARERIADINPNCKVRVHNVFFLPENASDFDFSKYDYVADAVDTVAAKMAIVRAAQDAGVKVISCMGAGNKLDPSAFEAADIFKTSVCPLAKVMRAECRKAGIKRLKVVYSKEPP